MLARLRHDGLVCRHVQHHEIHSADARHHVPDEPFVPRHVDERQCDVVFDGVRKSEVDCDAARLLFLKAIGIGARQREHERALAVIDMSRGTDDDVPHLCERGRVAEAPGSRTQPPRKAASDRF